MSRPRPDLRAEDAPPRIVSAQPKSPPRRSRRPKSEHPAGIPPSSPRRASSDPLAQALARLQEALNQALTRELASRPDLPPDLMTAPASARDLSMPVVVNLGASFDAEHGAAELRAALSRHLEENLAKHRAFRPGRVLDLRQGAAEGPASRPPDSRFVFAGYSPSGRPRFVDFAQWLLQLGHPDQDRLYARPPGLVTAVSTEDALYRDLLPAFGNAPGDQRLHGQVTAGWYEVRSRDGHPAPLAVTFQILSVAGPAAAGPAAADPAAADQAAADQAPRRLGLNLLLSGPDGEDVDEVYARLDDVPWRAAGTWARQALASVERSKDLHAPKKLANRLHGILNGLARRLEHQRRGRERRTGHAEARHQSGKRPTRQALRDLDQAPDREIFADVRKDTLIVLGDRGRVHVFNRRGKLVTSIRYSPDAIERKLKAEIWCPAGPGEIRDLRRDAVGQGMAAGDEPSL